MHLSAGFLWWRCGPHLLQGGKDGLVAGDGKAIILTHPQKGFGLLHFQLLSVQKGSDGDARGISVVFESSVIWKSRPKRGRAAR